MNIEQVEGQLSEFEGKPVAVALPIRGTVVQMFYGSLEITHDWENHLIIYRIRFYPDTSINFQAQDIHKITPTPSEEVMASIVLKSDACMEQMTHL